MLCVFIVFACVISEKVVFVFLSYVLFIHFHLAARDLTRTVGKLGRGIPLVPSIPVSVRPEIISERQSLPIFAHRAEILHAINQNQVQCDQIGRFIGL